MAVVNFANSGATKRVPEPIDKVIGPISWRGISFPISRLSTDVEQRLVEHEYPDRDGSYMESVGRKPIHIKAKIPFNNWISPGKGETWVKGDLFPNTYRKFVAACADNSPGVFEHPVYGKFTAKVHSFSDTLDPDNRGGVVLEVSWIEH